MRTESSVGTYGEPNDRRERQRDGITNVKSDYRIPWISVRVPPACYFADNLQNLMNFIFSPYIRESLSHERKLSKPRTIKTAGGNSRVSLSRFLCLSRINYTLMRGNVSSDRKGPSRIARYDRGGNPSVGYSWNSTMRALPKAPFLDPLVELALVASNYDLTASTAFTSADAIVCSMILRASYYYILIIMCFMERSKKKVRNGLPCVFWPGTRENQNSFFFLMFPLKILWI